MPFTDRFQFLLSLLSERLWIRPLGYGVLAVLLLAGASATDRWEAPAWLPAVPFEAVEKLLSVLATTMLAVATFAVASMVSAYAAASRSATPRAFRLIVADQSSQNALSTFVGSFIYSVLAVSAVETHAYGETGVFAVFSVTLVVFGWVVLTFVRWVDDIARLGRMGNTLARVEKATTRAFDEVGTGGALGGVPAGAFGEGRPVHADEVGHVQHVDMPALQAVAERLPEGGRITVEAPPGTFLYPGRALARVHVPGAPVDTGAPGSSGEGEDGEGFDPAAVSRAFVVGEQRSFVQDPRFGLVVLAEIASRALSPGVNDPGTAIDILGRMGRIFAERSERERESEDGDAPRFDRVHVVTLDPDDLFDDAFHAIARDGAALLEVGIRLQKVLASLAALGDEALARAARRHARLALARAEAALELPEDVSVLRGLAAPLVEGAGDARARAAGGAGRSRPIR